ncbi:MAG TPA: LapA family protein [Candidatus Polarisedimenticolaceae bacterium]|nr:LapA family protein [Candidatus Polarisedimenticolaceae bacterium]
MRILLILIILALILTLWGFAMTNLETRAPVTLWQTTYQDVPVWAIVFLSMLSGVVGVGILAVADGAYIRLKNRQITRELRRLETELNFLRTQPAGRRREPDVPGDAEHGEPGPPREEDETGSELASAPVYDEIDDDDPYTGGRAV